jgi:hypothetical protein
VAAGALELDGALSASRWDGLLYASIFVSHICCRLCEIQTGVATMKLSKIMLIVTTTLAVFGIGHVRALIAHGQFGCAVAAAQSWDGGSSETDDAAAEPDKKAPPPNIAGEWTGNLEDSIFGGYTIAFEIDQNGNKLSGQWSSAFDLAATTIKGSINGNGDLKLTMKAGPKGCHLAAVGQLVTESEIMMTYRIVSCKGIKKDHGFFTISPVL